MIESLFNRVIDLVYTHGISIIPLVSNEKKPLEKWEEFQSRRVLASEVLAWSGDCNIGIVTGGISGLVVVDCESLEDAKWFSENKGKSPCVAQTPRGFHFYFKHPGPLVQNAIKIKDDAGKPRYDVRGDGGYVVAPPSVVDGNKYSWRHELTKVVDLPIFDMSWRPDYAPACRKSITDGEAYIRQIQAVAGNGGHNATYRAVCRLKDAGLTELDALAAMVEWNKTNADPPWETHQLLHKIRDVFG